MYTCVCPFWSLQNTTADAGEGTNNKDITSLDTPEDFPMEEQEQQERSSIGAESYLGSSEFETFSILDETGKQ